MVLVDLRDRKIHLPPLGGATAWRVQQGGGCSIRDVWLLHAFICAKQRRNDAQGSSSDGRDVELLRGYQLVLYALSAVEVINRGEAQATIPSCARGCTSPNGRRKTPEAEFRLILDAVLRPRGFGEGPLVTTV